MGKSSTVRIRRSPAILVAAVLTFVGALPLATARWFLAPVLLVPLVVGVWAVRTGTDADAGGLRPRALLGQRRIAWAEVVELAADERGRVCALLGTGGTVVLPAVRPDDLPRLLAASGDQPLSSRRPPR